MVAESGFSGFLQIEINRGVKVIAGNRLLFFQPSHFTARAVDDHSFEAVPSAKRLVIFPLESALADEVAGFEIGEFCCRQFRLCHFTHVPEGMSSKFPTW